VDRDSARPIVRRAYAMQVVAAAGRDHRRLIAVPDRGGGLGL
jgi:hypothetical protein